MAQKFATYPSLVGKTVFITGGATGIGESFVEHFTVQGALVGFIDIDTDAGTRLATRLGTAVAAGPRFEHCDVTDISRLQNAIQDFAADVGGIDILVNNAASDDRHSVDSVDVAYWQNRMDVNLRHQFFGAQAVRESMAKRGGGSIINLGSIMVQMGAAGSIAYVTAKGAIQAMTRALAREFGRERIRVNCLIPGWIMTQRQIDLYLDKAGERMLLERQCLPDKLVPADVARMALFLAADDSQHCTSQSFGVDGGWV
jgi:NAD(P)-dependent dehydrogenase (short-subunit alcohol dehydrogenase family)